MGLSVGIEVPFLIFFFIFPIGSLSQAILFNLGGLGAHGALLVFIFSFYGFPAELIVVVEVTIFLINILLEVIYGLFLAIPNMKNIILFLIAKKRRINSGKYQNGLVKKINFLLILKR